MFKVLEFFEFMNLYLMWMVIIRFCIMCLYIRFKDEIFELKKIFIIKGFFLGKKIIFCRELLF